MKVIGQTVAFGCLAVAGACGVNSTVPVVDERRLDIVLVVVDALRRDAVGAYDASCDTTPFLDSLARSGALFDQAYAQGSQTFNSTATLFTSRYFPWTAVPREPQPIPGLGPVTQKAHGMAPILLAQNSTVAEFLRDGGYQTMGLFTNPHHHPTSGFWQGFGSARFLPRGRTVAYARAATLAAGFSDWYNRREVDRPYLAYVHFMDAHAPYRPLPQNRDRFVVGSGEDLSIVDGTAVEPGAADLAYTRSLYDAEVFAVDEALREIVSTLEVGKTWDRTVLVVASDHGEEFMDHGGLKHGHTLEKELVHVPLLIHGIPGAQPGLSVGEIVSNLDLAPTLVDLAAVEVPQHFQGRSLLPLLQDGSVGTWEVGSSFAWVGPHRSVTTPRWHFVVDLRTEEVRLYDNYADPLGHTDVAGEYSGIVDGFLVTIERYEAELRRVRRESRELAKGAAAPVEPEYLDQLKALGYAVKSD